MDFTSRRCCDVGQQTAPYYASLRQPRTAGHLLSGTLFELVSAQRTRPGHRTCLQQGFEASQDPFPAGTRLWPHLQGYRRGTGIFLRNLVASVALRAVQFVRPKPVVSNEPNEIGADKNGKQVSVRNARVFDVSAAIELRKR